MTGVESPAADDGRPGWCSFDVIGGTIDGSGDRRADFAKPLDGSVLSTIWACESGTDPGTRAELETANFDLDSPVEYFDRTHLEFGCIIDIVCG